MSEVSRQEEKRSYLTEAGELIIPIDVPARYHYWKEGSLTLAKILAELNASPEIVARYTKKAE